MIDLVRTYRSELPALIKIAFEGDLELLNDYHISPGSLEHCVENTLGLINTNADFYKDDMEIYAVEDGKRRIGYTVLIRNSEKPNELYSFGINIEFRKKDVLLNWLWKVKLIIGIPFYIVLFAKNTRAICFFEKNGFAVLRNSKYLNDETKTLIVCRQGV